jgi:hypothetical protein
VTWHFELAAPPWPTASTSPTPRTSAASEEDAVIDCRAQTFERHLYGYDLVPDNLRGAEAGEAPLDEQARR